MRGNPKGDWIGTWMSLGHTAIAELASMFPFQWLLFDLEHGYITEDQLLANFQAVKESDTSIIVRVGSVDEVLISRILDWGAHGIMLPHVNDPLKAIQCLQAMQYPPEGKRGFSTTARSFRFGKLAYNAVTHIKPLFYAQIETLEGVESAEAIAAVEGVDVLFVGPTDLKLNWETHKDKGKKEFNQLLEEVCVAALNHKKKAGILVKNIEDLPLYRTMGFSVFSIGSDLGLIHQGYKELISRIQ